MRSLRSLRLLTLTVGVGWLVTASGCHTWRPSVTGVAVLQSERPPDRLRVHVRGLEHPVTLYAPKVDSDSLIGRTTPYSSHAPGMAIALSDIEQVEVLRPDGGKTAVLIVGIGVTVALIAAAAAAAASAASWGSSSGGYSSGSDYGGDSCPLVYSWDGHQWRLDSGTFGGAIARSLARTDVDNLDYATPTDGLLHLRVANELDETDFVDALDVVAVDHAPGLSVVPDAAGTLHTVGVLESPIAASDFAGRDVLPRVRSADDWNWESSLTMRDTSRASDVRDGLVLTFTRPAGAARAHLVLDAHNTPWAAYALTRYIEAHGRATQAWRDSLDASPAMSQALGMRLAREAFLSASVWDGTRWLSQGLIWEAGPEIVKRQALELDLRAVPGDTVRVRLESVPNFWLVDQVALDFTADQPVTARPLTLTAALDSSGTDLRALLGVADGRYLALETGQRVALTYDVPASAPGMARSFVLRSTGWYRIHTPEAGQPDTAMLTRVAHEPGAISRIAVAMMNDALQLVSR